MVFRNFGTPSSLWDSSNKSYFEAARSSQKRSILGVCEYFGNEADAKRALRNNLFSHKNSYNKSYFEAARSSRKRSILEVCEFFGNEADAKRALLDGFFFSLARCRYISRARRPR